MGQDKEPPGPGRLRKGLTYDLAETSNLYPTKSHASKKD